MKKSRLYSIINIVLFILIAVGYFLPYYNGSSENMIKSMSEAHMFVGLAILLIGLIGCIFNKKEMGYLVCGYFMGMHAYFYLYMHSNSGIHLSLKQIGIGAYLQFFPAFLAFMVTLISSFKTKGTVVTEGVRNNAQVKTTINNGQMNMPVNSFQNIPVEQKEKEKTMPKPDLLAGTKVDNDSMFVNPNLMGPEENSNGMISKSEMDLFKQVNIISAESNPGQPIPMNSLGPTPSLNIPTPAPVPPTPNSMPMNLMGGAVPVQEPQLAPVPPVPEVPVAPQPEAPSSMPMNLMGGAVPAQEPQLAPVPPVPEVPVAPQPEASNSMPVDLMGGAVPVQESQLAPVPPVPEVPVAPQPEAPSSMPMDLMGVVAPVQGPQLAPVPPVAEAPQIPPVPQVAEQVQQAAPSNVLGGLPTPSKEGGQDISNIMNQGPSMEEQIKMFNEQQAQAMANNSNMPKPDLLAGSNLSGILGNNS